MTAEDLHKLMRIYFSRIGFKMWRNEKNYKLIDGVWTAVRGIGYPRGTPDLVGYRLSDCRVTMCENKTVNDKITKDQKKQMPLFFNDGVLIFEAHERKDGLIDFFEWQKLGSGIVKKKSTINVEKT